MARLTLNCKKVICTVMLVCLAAAPELLKFDLRTAGIFLIAVYAACIIAWLGITRNPFSLFFMFFAYCMLCNSGQVVLYTFSIEFDDFANIYANYCSALLQKALIFQAYCVLFLTCGAIWAYKQVPLSVQNSGRCHFDVFDFICIILFAIMLFVYVTKLASRICMNYGEYFYAKGGGTGTDVRLRLAFYVSFYLSYYKHRNDGFSWLVCIFAIVLGVIMLLVGTRSLVIPLISGPLFIKGLLGARMRLRKLPLIVVCIILLLVGLRVVKIIRAYSFCELSTDVLTSTVSEGVFTNLKNITAEMGSTAECLAETVQQCDRTDCEQSTTVMYSVLKSFLPVNLLEYLEIGSPEPLSEWVTQVGGGEKGTASWGYSVFAEMYANFDSSGFLAMFPFGWIWVKLENRAAELLKNKPILAMSVVYFLSYCIFLARGEMLLATSLARYCIYVAIFTSVKIKCRRRYAR